MLQRLKKYLKQFSKIRLYVLLFIFCALYSFYDTRNSFIVFVVGSSMEPTYHTGEILVAHKNFVLSKNDVIIFRHNNEIYIKRITGIEGETYSYSLTIPHEYQMKDYRKIVVHHTKGSIFWFKNYTYNVVPHDKYYVQGDNIIVSVDSKTYGLVDRKDIIGKIDPVQ